MGSRGWAEIRIAVSRDTAEAVANYAHEAGAGGLVIEDGDTCAIGVYFPADLAQEFLQGLAGFCQGLEKKGYAPKATVQVQTIAEQDWAQEWKKHYHPLTEGRFYICPSWLEPEPTPDQICLLLDPGLAFGTGTHATTRMCLRELGARAKGQRVLDLGTGSGILAIAAAKAGARRVRGIDEDPVAVRMAVQNAALNHCAIGFSVGDAFDEFAQGGHDLAMANIGYAASLRLAAIFRTMRNCTLILSGFPQERLEEFMAEWGEHVRQTHCLDGWVCLILEAG